MFSRFTKERGLMKFKKKLSLRGIIIYIDTIFVHNTFLSYDMGIISKIKLTKLDIANILKIRLFIKRKGFQKELKE